MFAEPHQGGDTGDTDGACAALCVLASGSRGNCSVLVTRGRPRRVTLIDAGLSPARTRRMLHALGIEPWEVDEILFTHLDSDHCHPGWCAALRTRRWRATQRVFERHMGRAHRMGLLAGRTEPFDECRFALGPVVVDPVSLSHDSLGVAAFRFAVPGEGGVGLVGFATDVGRVTPGLVEHLRGVDVLAIESNYCPVMQRNSGRPAFLQRRITGGSGHLSNEECAQAVGAIGPRSALVLLHLSQECNLPSLAAGPHAGAGFGVTVTSQHEPTGWVPVPSRAGRRLEDVGARVVMRTGWLFAPAPAGSVA